MNDSTKAKWLPLRAASAAVVIALLIVELLGHRSGLIAAVQTVCIFVIVVTSVFDLRNLRRRRMNR